MYSNEHGGTKAFTLHYHSPVQAAGPIHALLANYICMGIFLSSVMNPGSNDIDADLVIALNAGDRKAFEAIYRKYVSELFSYARRNISCKEDCEEIIQEVFESLWARHETLRVNTLRFYLISMVKYKIIRYFQHNSVKRKYAEHYKMFESAYDTAGEDQVKPEAIQKLIDNSILELPERCQVAFRLRMNENLSNGDIAARMNITKKTVEVYMFQAFKHFRSSYEKLSKAT